MLRAAAAAAVRMRAASACASFRSPVSRPTFLPPLPSATGANLRPLGIRCLGAPAAQLPEEPAGKSLDDFPSVRQARRAGLKLPSFSRRDRRERLMQALEACARGEEFQLPKPEAPAMPGPVGATMNVLREHGPLKLQALFDTVNERYPGLLTSKSKFKRSILKRAPLNNHLMKVRVGDAVFKDSFAIRRSGQIRTAAARGRRTRPTTTSARGVKDLSPFGLTRRGVTTRRPNQKGPHPKGYKKRFKK